MTMYLKRTFKDNFFLRWVFEDNFFENNMLEFYEQIVKLSPIPSSIDILSPAAIPASASAGVELGTAQPHLEN